MSIIFTPAKRENVGLLIGLAGGTGSGKTFSAMRLASGICGDKPFAMIDTENGRALHYADQFRFDHALLHPPFEPRAYAEAIKAADAAGYPVIVVDSMSHEWAGEGGVLEMHEAELQRLGGRDNMKMLAWASPKADHKKMVQRMLQVRAHLILCFRAEEKIEMKKDANNKTVIEKKAGLTGLDGWFPICEKNLPFELTTSFLLMAQRPGVPCPIKLQQQHRVIFPADQPITEESGKRLAAWASGGSVALAPTTAAGPLAPCDIIAKRWQKLHPKPANQSAKMYQEQFYFFVKSRVGQDITAAKDLTDESIEKLSIVLDEMETARQQVAA